MSDARRLLTYHGGTRSEETLDWVERFYSLKSDWLGEPVTIWDYERARARTIERLCGLPPKRVLELGAGSGGAAAATADLGYDVTAVELSTLRAANARQQASRPHQGTVTVVEGDFYSADLGTGFDVVAYWDGFGVGTDDDQHQLLARIAEAWLAPDGIALVEVFGPWAWARDAGKEKHSAERRVRARLDFHPLECRFTETVWPEDHASLAVTQTIRCYSPADFARLLDGTGLRVAMIQSATDLGNPMRLDTDASAAKERLVKDPSYLVVLERS